VQESTGATVAIAMYRQRPRQARSCHAAAVTVGASRSQPAATSPPARGMGLGPQAFATSQVTTRPRASAQDPGLWRRPGRPECHQTSAELHHPGGRRVVCARRGAAHDDGCPRLLAGPGPAPAATARGGPRGTSACAAVGLAFHLLVSIPLQMDHMAEQRAQRTRSDRPQQRS
jgi:hypothetical protein